MADTVGFEGVLYGDAVTFTSSPDRTAFSFLYDNFVVQWLPNDSSDDDAKTGARHLALAAAQGSAGLTLALDLRGASYGNLGEEASLTLYVGKQNVSVPLSRDEEAPNIYHRIEMVLEEDRSVCDIRVKAVVPKPDPEGTQASIHVDSIDVTLLPAACSDSEAAAE